jgi:TolA-binding protein
VRYLLGVAQIESGRTADGLRTLGQFVAAEPTHDLVPTARVLMAETEVKAGRLRDAIEQYRAVAKTAPQSPLTPKALYQVGELSQRLGRVADAEAAWTTLRRDYPGDALASPAGLEMASLYLKRRQYEQAMETARAVADGGGSERLEALLVLGESALQARRTAEARRAYAAAVAEAPADSAARYRGLAGVGLVAEVQREREAAKRAYQEIVDGARDAELVRWAQARLKGLEPRPAPPRAKPKPRPKTRSGARP